MPYLSSVIYIPGNFYRYLPDEFIVKSPED